MSKEQRSELLRAITDCEHSMTDGRVTLHFDKSKPGNNALHQLVNRIAAALASPAAEPVKHWCTNCMGVDPASCALNNALASPPATKAGVPADVKEAARSFVVNGYRGPLPMAKKVFDWVADTPKGAA